MRTHTVVFMDEITYDSNTLYVIISNFNFFKSLLDNKTFTSVDLKLFAYRPYLYYHCDSAFWPCVCSCLLYFLLIKEYYNKYINKY